MALPLLRSGPKARRLSFLLTPHARLYDTRHGNPRDTFASPAPRRTAIRHVVLTTSAIGVAVCLALLPAAAAQTVYAPGWMDTWTTLSQAGLVRHLKRTVRFTSPRVERALLNVDRKHFVEATMPFWCIYKDQPLPIGFNETISAPHMHATCLELLEQHVTEKARVLDVGSGSGYLTAALAMMGGPESFVLGVEKHCELAEQSISNIRNSNPELLEGEQPRVQIMAGNALSAILEHMEPFDAIHVGAAASSIPERLVEKLNPGGRMVVPVGPQRSFQELLCIDKDQDGSVTVSSLMQVRYVPLTTPTEGPGSIPVN